MRKLGIWIGIGISLAVICGVLGLAHLSATLVTLTVFCSVPALLILLLDRPKRHDTTT